MLPTNALYYGKDEPPQQIALRAGPLSLVYENGDLHQPSIVSCQLHN
jgi:hypothetical protein